MSKVDEMQKDFTRRHRFVVCKACGHPVPENDVVALLSGKQRRLFEIIARAGAVGIGVHEVMTELYALDPTGRPANNNIVSVMAHHINRKIKSKGLALACRRGPFGHWRLTELESDHEPEAAQPDPGR